jgi:hypothetical protein
MKPVLFMTFLMIAFQFTALANHDDHWDRNGRRNGSGHSVNRGGGHHNDHVINGRRDRRHRNNRGHGTRHGGGYGHREPVYRTPVYRPPVYRPPVYRPAPSYNNEIQARLNQTYNGKVKLMISSLIGSRYNDHREVSSVEVVVRGNSYDDRVKLCEQSIGYLDGDNCGAARSVSSYQETISLYPYGGKRLQDLSIKLKGNVTIKSIRVRFNNY